MMQDIFTKLRALQDILSNKFEIDNDMKEIPKILTTKIELLNRLKKSYIGMNNEIAEKKQRIKEIRQHMMDAEMQRDKYEQQMDHVKTQREYEALDKEIKITAENESELRRQLQKEEKNYEEMVAHMQLEETMIKKQEDEIRSEQSRIKHELKDKGKQLKNLEKEESKITPGLDEEILFKFERIIKNKAGVGIVPILNDICTGCHMILTAQYVNDIRIGKEIMFCPNCSRILFFQETGIKDEHIEEDEEEEEELIE